MDMKIIAPCAAFIATALILTAIFWLGGWGFERGAAAACLAALAIIIGLAVVNAVVAVQNWGETE